MKRFTSFRTACIFAAALSLSIAAFANDDAGSADQQTKSTKTSKKASKSKKSDATKKKEAAPVTELKIEDVKVGTGATAEPGKMVTVHYTGTLTNGKKFDSSKDHGTPFSFPLGAGRVIQGWEKGVAGMKVGGIRKLTIPPSMGYGDRDMGVIPPNSTLLFDVELLDVK